MIDFTIQHWPTYFVHALRLLSMDLKGRVMDRGEDRQLSRFTIHDSRFSEKK
jgi:hypothetical protein